MSAEDTFCAACYAEAGEPCSWDCIGLASQVDALEASLDVQRESALTVSSFTAHCLICQAATPARGDYLIARALTVAASRLYAELNSLSR